MLKAAHDGATPRGDSVTERSEINIHSGETTGNFPSAAVHLGLINAALYVGAARSRSQSGASLTSRLMGMPEMEHAGRLQSPS